MIIREINIAQDHAIGEPVTMIDYGLKIKLTGMELPTAYEVHFSNSMNQPATVAIGDASGVVVPYEYTEMSGTLYGWLYLHNDMTDGYTARSFALKINRRATVDPPQVLPPQADIITQAIVALNMAIERSEAARDEAEESAGEAEQSAQQAATAAAGAAGSESAAQGYAQQAEAAKTAAETAAGQAQASATAAASSASAASTSQATASAAATRAENAMDVARTSATSAAESAGLAQTAMEESADNAQAAADSATAAAESATSAATSATNASTSATNAATSATAAQTAQTAAEEAATTAAGKATEASESAADAAESAAEAEAAVTEAGQIVDDVEAWALGAYATSSASGAVATVDDGAENVPVKALTAYIVPVQDGTGDPSPDNVRAIHGWAGMNITHSPTLDPQDGTVYPVAWSDVAGTVYGGYFDAVTGVLTVAMAAVDMGDLTWEYNISAMVFYALLDPISKYNSVSALANAVCSCYPVATYNQMGDKQLSIAYVFRRGANVKDSRFTNAADFKAAVTGQMLVYEVETPITYQLSPVEIKTLKGVNNIFADTGDTSVTVRADPDLHLTALIAQAVALSQNG